MSKQVEITWEVDDGYGGGSRPHIVCIDVAEFEGLNDGEATELIHEFVQEEFEQKISWRTAKIKGQPEPVAGGNF